MDTPNLNQILGDMTKLQNTSVHPPACMDPHLPEEPMRRNHIIYICNMIGSHQMMVTDSITSVGS